MPIRAPIAINIQSISARYSIPGGWDSSFCEPWVHTLPRRRLSVVGYNLKRTASDRPEAAAALETCGPFVSAIDSASPVARGPQVLAPAGRAGGAEAGQARDRQSPPRSCSSRTSPRPARSSGRSDVRLWPHGDLHAGREMNRSSRHAHSARNAAGGTTSHRRQGIRHIRDRSAALRDRCPCLLCPLP